MTNPYLMSAIAFSVLAFSTPIIPAQQTTSAPDSDTLFDFRGSEHGHLSLNAPAGNGASLTLQPPAKKWDIGDYTRLELDVANTGTQKMQIRVFAMNQSASDWGNSAINTGFLAPRERKIFNVFLYRQYDVRNQYPALKPFEGMSGLPGGLLSHWHTIDAKDVRGLQIEIVGASAQSQQLQIFSIRATHPIVPKILREKGAGFFSIC